MENQFKIIPSFKIYFNSFNQKKEWEEKKGKKKEKFRHKVIGKKHKEKGKGGHEYEKASDHS